MGHHIEALTNVKNIVRSYGYDASDETMDPPESLPNQFLSQGIGAQKPSDQIDSILKFIPAVSGRRFRVGERPCNSRTSILTYRKERHIMKCHDTKMQGWKSRIGQHYLHLTQEGPVRKEVESLCASYRHYHEGEEAFYVAHPWLNRHCGHYRHKCTTLSHGSLRTKET